MTEKEEKNSSGCTVLPDVQSSADSRHIPILQVGVKSVQAPLAVAAEAGPQPTVATVNMYVSLPAKQKGTHMSRFFRLLKESRSPVDKAALEDLMTRMLTTLGASAGFLEIEFPFFMNKTAPVSGQSSLLNYRAGFSVTRKDGETKIVKKVVVPVTSLCPCSKEISRFGAHNQRSHITIEAVCLEDVPFEDLIRTAEKNASCELWSLLKREDEKFVTEYAYEHAKFVEDIARDVATAINADSRIASYKLQVENFESIHNHSAYALITHGDDGRQP